MFQITTHSDYMMQRINQLIKLGALKRDNKDVFEEYTQSKGLNKDTYLDKEMIKGYYFSRGSEQDSQQALMVYEKESFIGKDSFS
ncbi:MAG: hypothetical protein K2N13_04235 [Paraprevotella sp.]|nr:hypothetical protein [Paraprevotella sp.]